MATKPRKLTKNSEDHLAALMIFCKGFEHYEGVDFKVQGLRNSDYRWQVTFKKTGRIVQCSSLVECVGVIERACLDTSQKEPAL